MSSLTNSAASAAKAVVDPARRRSMLSALDIDVWQVRTSAEITDSMPVARAADAQSVTQPEGQAEQRSSTSGHAGPAAAMALLADAQAGGLSAPSAPASPTPPASPTAAQASSSAPSREDPEPVPSGGAVAAEPAVDLACLVGPHGVLLAEFAGLSPAGNRLLNDILQAAMRLAAPSGALIERDKSASAKAPKLRLQQLRFSWPPTEDHAALGAGASTGRALRGFLNRQLQGKENALLLYASSDVRTLLKDIELSVDAQRILYIGEPEALLGDGAAKRALWQTLNTL